MVQQDTSALTSVRLARALRRAIVAIIFAALLTPVVYFVTVLATTGNTDLFQGDYGYLLLGTFQYQVAPSFALFPNLVLLVGVTLLGIPRVSPWIRTAIIAGAAILAAVATMFLAAATTASGAQIFAMCLALVLGWTLASLPLSSKKPGWGRP